MAYIVDIISHNYYYSNLIMTKQVEYLVLATAVLASAMAPKAGYAYYQPDEEVNQIVVDKQIKGLSEAEWKDNYPSSYMVFGPNTQFEFKITVKNTGNRNLTWIKVTDSLPRVLNYTFGREGATFNGDNSTINWQIPEIKPGEEQSTVIRVQTKGAQSIPKALTEKVNKVCVKAESNASDCDESHFWVGNGESTTSAQVLPVTGANPMALIGMGSALAAGLFFSLKKLLRV